MLDSVRYYSSEKNYREIFKYNQNSLYRRELFEYDSNLVAWRYYRVIEYITDSTDHQINTVYQLYNNATQQLENDYRDIYQYNESMQLVVWYRVDYWDLDSSAWDPQYRTFYHYTPSYLIDSTYSESWDASENQWVPLSYTNFYYNEVDSNLSSIVFWFWDPAQGKWYKSNRGLFFYNEQGQYYQDVEQIWDTVSTQWQDNYRTTYIYDSLGRCTGWLFDSWDANQQEWISYRYEQFAYDEKGRKIQHLIKKWSNVADQFVNYQRGDYTYDNRDNPTHFEGYKWLDSSWVPKEAECNFGSPAPESNSGSPDYYYHYYYYALWLNAYYHNATAIGPKLTGGVVSRFELSANYPNPFNSTTTFYFSLPQRSKISINVYNILGQKVAELIKKQWFSAGRHKIHFNGQNLPSGLYFCRLETANTAITRKMILLK